MIQSDQHIFTGLQQDTTVSLQKPEFLCDARNIRITARDGKTAISLTNERGTTLINSEIEGSYLGHCVLDNKCIIFSHENSDESPDHISKLEYEDNEWKLTSLYDGNLGFEGPIETLGVYERKDVQKVYWVDGKNQPRVINICNIKAGDDTQFDFIPKLRLEETVEVTKIVGQGSFNAGTVQYAFSYFYKYGQESNIFLTTPLQYISFNDRGGSPTETVANSFKIEISNVETKFDYLRVYSIRRTSFDGVPQCRIVEDINIPKPNSNDPVTITFIDDGSKGEIIDNYRMLYVGGEDIVASTLCAKDGTLFLGNLQLTRNAIESEARKALEELREKESGEGFTVGIDTKEYTTGIAEQSDGIYEYASNLPVKPGFKSGEHYRIGIQLQDETGKWSEPFWIKDVTIEGKKPSYEVSNNLVTVKVPIIKIQIDDTTGLEHYKKIRPVCVFPNINDRLVLTQGLLNPTVFSIKERKEGTLFAQSSWFYRPTSNTTDTAYNWYHNIPLGHDNSYELKLDYPHMEIQGSQVEFGSNTKLQYLSYNTQNHSRKEFAVDQQIVTLNSPEVEFDQTVQTRILDGNYKLNIVGYADFPNNKTQVNYLIELLTPSTDGDGIKEFKRVKPMLSDYLYEANGVAKGNLGTYTPTNKGAIASGDLFGNTIFNWMVFPWHGDMLTNDDNREAAEAQIKKKTLAQCHFSNKTYWLDNPLEYTVDAKMVNEQNIMTRLKNPYSIEGFEDIIYKGDIDTLLYLDYPKYTTVVVGKDAQVTIDWDTSEWDFTVARYVSGMNIVNLGNSSSRKLHLVPKAVNESYDTKYPQLYDSKNPMKVFGISASIWKDPLDDKDSYSDDYIIPTDFTILASDFNHNFSDVPTGYTKDVSRDDAFNYIKKYEQGKADASDWWNSGKPLPLVTSPLKRPIRLRYKSSPHIVMSLLVDDSYHYILPKLEGFTVSLKGDNAPSPYWMSAKSISEIIDEYNPVDLSGRDIIFKAANDADASGRTTEGLRNIYLAFGPENFVTRGAVFTVEEAYDYEKGAVYPFRFKLLIDTYLANVDTPLWVIPVIAKSSTTEGQTSYTFSSPLGADTLLTVRPFQGSVGTYCVVAKPQDNTNKWFIYKRPETGGQVEMSYSSTFESGSQLSLLQELLIEKGFLVEGKSLLNGIDIFNRVDCNWEQEGGEWVPDGDIQNFAVTINGVYTVLKPIYDNNTTVYVVAGSTGETEPFIENGHGVYSQEVNLSSDDTQDEYHHPYLWVGELVREANVDTDFGGDSKYALKNNQWYPVGEPKPLGEAVEADSGDTWFQRHDCLKTYPYALEDTNSIVEIASFMCETRVNLDGRYDKIKNTVKRTTAIDPTIMNNINPAYNQLDNYFTYRILDDDMRQVSDFPNQVAWSLQKNDTSIIDDWTNITLASTLNLDATKGQLRALRVFKDSIVSFQDKALSQINFNNRVQIPTSDGVPIEITNNMKVDGYKVWLDGIGCSNKESICINPTYMYFIEHTSKQLYRLGGESSGELSSSLNMGNWFKINNSDSDKAKVFYDYNNKDIYVVYPDDCLVFSETLGQFTSFMDYKEAKAMFNIGNSYFSIVGDSTINPYLMFSGDYNYIFGKYRDYSLSFISNPNFALDKTFTNLEVRADFLNKNKTKPETIDIEDNKFFDYIKVNNEYQSAKDNLVPSIIRATNCIKKFRQWRVEIPRTNGMYGNRMRNNWVKIKLGIKQPEEEKDKNKLLMNLHNLNVVYHI